MANKSKVFVRQLNEFAGECLPADVITRSKRSLLDYLSVAYAGAEFFRSKMWNYGLFSEPGGFFTVGKTSRHPLKSSVFMNGLYAHALDLDDGTNAGIIHLGSPIFSLLLPIAEKNNASMEKLLRSAVTGYQASYTLACSLQPEHKLLGYHATGTCGTVGAALALSYMLDISEEERFQIFGAACAASSGMLQVLDDGSELKPYNVAKASLLALTAVEMGTAGFKVHPDPLGGERGFMKMMTGEKDTAVQDVFRDNRYAITEAYIKPYASCRYTHPSIDAALKVRREVEADEIETIQIKTYSLAVKGHDHVDIPDAAAGKMSIPYGVAVALVYGKVGLQEFSEKTLADKRIKDLCRRITVSPDSCLSQAFPSKQPAKIAVRLKNGREKTYAVDIPYGEPEMPMSEETFRNRYGELMEYGGVSSQTSEYVYNGIMDGTADLNELCGALLKGCKRWQND